MAEAMFLVVSFMAQFLHLPCFSFVFVHVIKNVLGSDNLGFVFVLSDVSGIEFILSLVLIKDICNKFTKWVAEYSFLFK